MKAKTAPVCLVCLTNAFRYNGGRWLCADCHDRAREQDALNEVAKDRAQAIVEAEPLRVEVAARGDA